MQDVQDSSESLRTLLEEYSQHKNALEAERIQLEEQIKTLVLNEIVPAIKKLLPDEYGINSEQIRIWSHLLPSNQVQYGVALYLTWNGNQIGLRQAKTEAVQPAMDALSNLGETYGLQYAEFSLTPAHGKGHIQTDVH